MFLNLPNTSIPSIKHNFCEKSKASRKGGFFLSLPLEETPLLGEMSQTEGSAVSGEEKVAFAQQMTDEVFYQTYKNAKTGG